MWSPLRRCMRATASAERGAAVKRLSSARKPPGKRSRWGARPPVTRSLARKTRSSLLRMAA
eukprot:6252761-Prorocentrum_lima.AAC.1